MKFRILNKKGDETLTLEKKNIAKEFNRLKENGYEAVTKTGQKIEKAEKVPDTVEELIFSKPLQRTGNRGN
ncbi:unnamed protein product [marine sediment metagenome]|uniref:Uncharacterized protein n=1 Tax=marine sediment metagenome TaxID=412755 RepID=X1I7R9_9ZZZZ